jgi:peptide/nickel transport system substrate-binding protein
MKLTHRGAMLIALSGVVAITAAACGGGSSGKSSNSSSGSIKAGGTLYYLSKRPVEHWDPTRTYIGRDIFDEAKLFVRTLTAFPSLDGKASLKIAPDMATDTGTASDDAKTWKFTLKDGIKWQDGKPVTCDDLKYGISRSFATDVLTGGPNYPLQFFDIGNHKDKDGNTVSNYVGPYLKTGQAEYDKAVVCEGNSITFHLKKTVADFNYATYLPVFAAYRQDQDKGDKSNYSVFSDGPYMLQGTWTLDKGGTFVRNPNYDPKSDSPTLRHAYPDKIVFVEGLTDEVIMQRLISDAGNDKFAVTDRRVPPAYQAQANGLKGANGKRQELVQSPFNDYVVPNFKRMTNPLVRQALVYATDKNGWITANGGPTYGKPAQGMINPSVLGYKAFNAFNAPDGGDPAKAKSLLQQAGVQIPYPINLTYNGGTPTNEKAAAVLKAGWEKGGFKVTLNELTDTYYDVIQNPSNAKKFDVTWAGWGADWPNASTVIPPLFDSRVNLSAASTGQDYGYYANDAVNAAMDKAFATTDLQEQAKQWGDIDEMLAKDVAYIPLDFSNFFLIWGSGVKGWVDNPAYANYPDLGAVGVA